MRIQYGMGNSKFETNCEILWLWNKYGKRSPNRGSVEDVIFYVDTPRLEVNHILIMNKSFLF